MRFAEQGLFLVVLVCVFGRAYPAAGALDDVCKPDGTCDQSLVCDPPTTKCKVLADGSATDCSSSDTNCPTNAACSTTTCSCNTGYTQSGGLCSVVGDTCSSDSDCTSKLTNTQCVKTSPCIKGTCQCKDGFSGPVCLLLGNDATCVATLSLCGSGFTCDSGTTKCTCSTGTYKTEISACSDKKMFDVACGGDAECYANQGGSGNGKCSTTCGCADGYIKDTATQLCRQPYRTETCYHGVACGKVDLKGLLASEGSQATPTCSAPSAGTTGTCDCATSGQTMESAQKGTTCYNYCLTTHSGTTTADSQACTTHSQCTSKVCIKCPGDASGLCYSAPCGNGSGMKKTERGMIMLSFILLLAFIF